jgi:hypothetical protein
MHFDLQYYHYDLEVKMDKEQKFNNPIVIPLKGEEKPFELVMEFEKLAESAAGKKTRIIKDKRSE